MNDDATRAFTTWPLAVGKPTMAMVWLPVADLRAEESTLSVTVAV
jgi:hypothetical protein